MSVEGLGLTVEQLLSRGRFTPARVQRGYRWGDEHQTQLLDDLEAELRRAGESPYRVDDDLLVVAAEGAPPSYGPGPSVSLSARNVRRPPARPKAYFLGHMLFDKTRAEDRFEIYDGQQRLTTLMLLLSALRDALPDGDDRARASALVRDPSGQPRLFAPTPGGMLARVIGAEGCRVKARENEVASDVSIRTCARAFLDRFEDYTERGKRAMLNFVRHHVFVSATFFADRRLAETAYMTVNTRGLRLDAAEVLKGHVVQVVSDVSHEDGKDIERSWERLERDAGDAFAGFLRTLAFGLFRREQAAQDYLPDWLDEFGDGPVGAERVKVWVRKTLPDRWKTYERIATVPGRADDLRGSALYLRQLGFLPWDEWRSVALALIEGYPETAVGEPLRRLRDACYVMQLNGWDDRHDQRVRVLSRALEELDNQESPFSKGSPPGALVMFENSRRRARSALRVSMPPHRARPIVRFVETLLWVEASLDPAGFVGDGSVEHVLPVAYHAEPWPGFTGDEREELKGCLGNLCMLPFEVNEKLDRSSYDAKRAEYLALRPKWRSAHDVATQERWTATAVRARTERLAQLVVNALDL